MTASAAAAVVATCSAAAVAATDRAGSRDALAELVSMATPPPHSKALASTIVANL
jgi:hypothetical protein